MASVVPEFEAWCENRLGLRRAVEVFARDLIQPGDGTRPPAVHWVATHPDALAPTAARGHDGIAAGRISELGPVSAPLVGLRSIGALLNLVGSVGGGHDLVRAVLDRPVQLAHADEWTPGSGWPAAAGDEDLSLDPEGFPFSYHLIMRSWRRRLATTAPERWLEWRPLYVEESTTQTLLGRRWQALALLKLYVRIASGIAEHQGVPASEVWDEVERRLDLELVPGVDLDTMEGLR